MKVEKETYEHSLNWGRFAGVPISKLDTRYLERIYREASQTVYFVGPELERRRKQAEEIIMDPAFEQLQAQTAINEQKVSRLLEALTAIKQIQQQSKQKRDFE